MPRRALLWSAAAVSLAALLVVGFVCQGPPRTRVGEDWTPARLHEELVNAGEEWEAHPVPAGLVLRRPGTWPDWDALVEASRDYALFPTRRDCLHVEHTGMSGRWGAYPEGNMQLGKLVIRGHPDELKRVTDRFAP